MKRCSRCRIVKPAEQFYRSTTRKDGRDHYCSDCRKAHMAAYQATERGKAIKTRATYASMARHPERVKARQKVNTAIRSGRLAKEPCEVGYLCNGRIEAHHGDYKSALTVRWLCKRHHEQLHHRGLVGSLGVAA